MDLDTSQNLAPVRCTIESCHNLALVVFADLEDGGGVHCWCLGHAYLTACPACDVPVWSCPLRGCGACQGITETANDALQVIGMEEDRALGLSN